MVHFLFTPIPAAGHMGPAMALVDEVVRRGHDVTVASGPRYRARIERSGARFVGFRNAPDLDLEHLEEAFPERPVKSGVAQFEFDAKRLTIDQAVAECKDLQELVDADPPDAVVSDLMGFSGQFLAEDRAIPLALLNAVHLIQQCRRLPGPHVRPQLDDSRTAAQPHGQLARLRPPAPRRQSTPPRDAGAGRAPAVSASFMAIGAEVSQLILQATVPEFEYLRSDLPPQVHFIGALLPPDPTDWEPPGWWPRLGPLSIRVVEKGRPFYWLHAWLWKPSPTGLFELLHPDVGC